MQSEIWLQLQQACTNRQHGWRSPVLATTDSEGHPNARTVVLREADAALKQLVIFTDLRSPKVQELGNLPHAMLVFWCAQLSWQLRAKVHIQVLSEGARVEQAWNRLKHSAAAADYLQAAAPGSVLGSCSESEPPKNVHVSHQLCLLVATVQQMDWLELSWQGHQRQLFTHNGVQKLTP